MNKICSKCGVDKSLDEFHTFRSRHGKQQQHARCKVCRRADMRAVRDDPVKREKDRVYASSLRDERRALLHKWKNRPCVDCHQTYPPCVMDFDHMDAVKKTGSIGSMITRSAPLAKILKEIEGCELVCANCHRIRTHNRLHPR